MALDLDELVPENKVLGPVYRRGLEQGREEGREQGERIVLRRQVDGRFGMVPSWAEARLNAFSAAELDELATRVLDARSIEQLFPEQ